LESLLDLSHGSDDLRAAIPVLLEWLPRIENRDVKEHVVRALSDRLARPEAAPVLVSEFRRAEDDVLRWAIGNALAEVADDSVFREVAEFTQTARFGKAREMVRGAAGDMHQHRAEAIIVLRGLLADDQVAGHAPIALGKLRATEARGTT